MSSVSLNSHTHTHTHTHTLAAAKGLKENGKYKKEILKG